eukprot:768750-Hanusia_phi.AAC.5
MIKPAQHHSNSRNLMRGTFGMEEEGAVPCKLYKEGDITSLSSAYDFELERLLEMLSSSRNDLLL